MSQCLSRNKKAKLAEEYNQLLKELSSPKIKSIGCYSLHETIGRGSYGKVKLGVHQLTGKLVAIKKINKKHAYLMAREIHHHRQLQHPHIVSLYEILSTETNIFIVSEYCHHGDLLMALTRHRRFSEHRTKKWFLQLSNAISFCHSLGIIHRDIKLENVLLDENDNVKICDFGFARQIERNQLLETFCGSLAYSAPEVIQRQTYSGPATDVWSLGVILYTLLAGELPFDDDCESVMQQKVVSTSYKIPSFFSSEVADLVQKILKLNPFERLTINQITTHPWLDNPSICLQPTSAQLNLISPHHEKQTAHSLIDAGFERSIVDEMRHSKSGMLGTLWKMLLSKSRNMASELLLPNSHCATQTDQNEGWISSFKHWSISKPNDSDQNNSGTIQPNTTEKHWDMYRKKKCVPIQEEEDLNTSTCSSVTAEDEYDDNNSTASSPATSVDEEESKEELAAVQNMTAFHNISPMPSRADILLPRSLFNIEERQHKLRDRISNKAILEEDEEEEE